METVADVVKHWAVAEPDAEVLTFVNKHGRLCVYTPSRIYTEAGRFASRLLQFGFSRGDVIANGIPNSPERLVTDMGIILSGCVTVNCQVFERDGADFWNTANLAGCKGVIVSTRSTDPAFRLFQPLLPQPDQTSGCAEVTTHLASGLRKVVLCSRDDTDNTSLLRSLQSSDEEIFVSQIDPDDLAVLFATSGTSGFCKLVPRTHAEILRAGRSFKGGKDVKYFSDRPFGWMGGFPFDYLAHCSHRVLQDKYSGEQALISRDLWTVISREKCTGAAILPLTLLELIEDFKDTKPEFKLPFIVTGGQSIKKNLSAALGLLTDNIVVSYSSSEVAMVCVGNITATDQFNDFYSGKPSPGIEILIVDEQGRKLGPNQEGEIYIKSPFMMTNYYPPQPISSIFSPDGFFKTGDRGLLTEADHLYCYGRAGEVISQGAVLVYTSWPEGILGKCPDVSDAIVVNMPDTSGEDRLIACVVPRPGSGLTKAKLLHFYQSSFMSMPSSSQPPTSPSVFCRPEISDILFFEQFPETQTGKVSTRDLKSIVRQRLAL
ncbi:unnamed protein product [Lymnaea stagnalis]|uniref:AMP-dependent synthetase/ligase domain-containing protein n=1 Tax=Lymnaea stagnalis TaxID=6523 RepID=A0AAV2HF78_LYMST